MERKEVFISYKSEDQDQALWLKSVLETNGISCWMAPASIPGGSSYAKEIPAAIANCRVFVVVLTKRCQDSIWVPKELDMALNSKKTVMPFVLDDCALTADFNFYLSNVQRYAAYMNKVSAAERMVRDIQALLNVQQKPIPQKETADKKQKLSNIGKKGWVAAVAVLLVLSLVAGLWLGGIGLTPIDAFQGLTIQIEGAAPYGSVVLENRSADPFLQSISYTALPDQDLCNGDSITITANVSAKEARAQGYRLKSNTMEYMVADLPAYIMDPGNLQAADVAQLEEEVFSYLQGFNIGWATIHLLNGGSIELDDTAFIYNLKSFSLLDTAYCGDAQENMLVLPFVVNLENVEHDWWDQVYYEDGYIMSYPALYGYAYIWDLLLDQNGKLINSGFIDVNISDLYESEDMLKTAISESFPGTVVSGTLQLDQVQARTFYDVYDEEVIIDGDMYQ